MRHYFVCFGGKAHALAEICGRKVVCGRYQAPHFLIKSYRSDRGNGLCCQLPREHEIDFLIMMPIDEKKALQVFTDSVLSLGYKR